MNIQESLPPQLLIESGFLKLKYIFGEFSRIWTVVYDSTQTCGRQGDRDTCRRASSTSVSAPFVHPNITNMSAINILALFVLILTSTSSAYPHLTSPSSISLTTLPDQANLEQRTSNSCPQSSAVKNTTDPLTGLPACLISGTGLPAPFFCPGTCTRPYEASCTYPPQCNNTWPRGTWYNATAARNIVQWNFTRCSYSFRSYTWENGYTFDYRAVDSEEIAGAYVVGVKAPQRCGLDRMDTCCSSDLTTPCNIDEFVKAYPSIVISPDKITGYLELDHVPVFKPWSSWSIAHKYTGDPFIMCPNGLGPYVCVHDCTSGTYYNVRSRSREMTSLLQCSGPDDKSCTAFADPKCTIPAANQQSPTATQDGYLGQKCWAHRHTPNITSWCQTAIPSLICGRTIECYGKSYLSVIEDYRCMPTCELSWDGTPVRWLMIRKASVPGQDVTTQCHGPNSTTCSWYADPKCQILAPNEPEPVGTGGVICTYESRKTDGWCSQTFGQSMFSKPLNCPNLAASSASKSSSSIHRSTATTFPTNPSATAQATFAPSISVGHRFQPFLFTFLVMLLLC